MSFGWTEYLTFAERIQVTPNIPGPSEAALRSATSRAYYAAFQSELIFSRNEGFQPDYSGADHWAVRRHFRDYKTNKIRNKISTDLGRLYDNRRQADYDNVLNKSADVLAQLTIGMARSVLKNLEALRNDDP